MKDVFVIANQHKQFLGKQGQWLDESEPSAAWRSPHRDVALNHMIEVNARDIEQRLVLLQCPLNEKDIPLLGDTAPARKSAPVTFDEPDAVALEPDDEVAIDTDIFSERIHALLQGDRVNALQGMRRGIEKESLRVTPEGKLAQTPHPVALGSALKHPNITTDFSEALLEFITPPCKTIDDALAWLDCVHAYTYSVLAKQDEKLWVASMPCVLESDDQIPLAQYGSSHNARMKTVYREGLGNRYGRVMQTIAGIHYNVSFPDALWQILQEQDGDTGSLQDFKTQRYFDLIRNFRRYMWLLLYLFGSSPAICPTFLQGRNHKLQAFDDQARSLYLPAATSLRMGDLGYQSNAQSALTVCYNGLETYISTLKKGLTTSFPAYEEIGVCDASGHYRQLNTNLLQIENEFYSTIRPKRVTQPGETPIVALHEGGVEYIEVRCMDLNPYLPAGIDADAAHFIEAFLLWCLLSESPVTDAAEYQRLIRNQTLAVERGRDAELLLEDGEQQRKLSEWGLSFFDKIAECAALLDTAYGSKAYTASVEKQRVILQDSSLTPAAAILRDMQEQKKSFFRLACDLSAQHAEYFSSHALSPEKIAYFEEAASLSVQKQKELEEKITPDSFDEYLSKYYSQYEKV
ncbi:MAG TPA: glutamate--cysteine ligase [Pseudomonadales bacterium]|nr:glutamate--cysteine ligase [Pseudomonadales bacterium]